MRLEKKVTPQVFYSKNMQEYFSKKHAILLNDYKVPEGQGRDACTLIACEVAKIFLKEGKTPYIVKIKENEKRGGWVHNKILRPVLFGGRVTWRTHHVCCYNGIAYDPMLGEPVSLNEYTLKAFGENIQVKMLIPEEQIKEFVLLSLD